MAPRSLPHRFAGVVALVVAVGLALAVVTTWAGGAGRQDRRLNPVPPLRLIPAEITLTSAESSAHVQDAAIVTVRVGDREGRAVGDTEVVFRIAGVNSAVPGSCEPVDCRSDPQGLVRFRYAGASVGQDRIIASTVQFPIFEVADLIWTPSVRGSSLAVLGDSYSSGEGTSDFLPGTDVAGVNLCHRSPLAFGPLVEAAHPFPSLAFRACAGAVTDDLFTSNSAGNKLADGTVEPAQLCVECTTTLPAAVGPDTTAVTLTIGGNDAGFSQVLASCLWVSELHLNYGRPGRGCSTEASIVGPVTTRLAALAGEPGSTASAPDGRPIHSIRQILAQIHALAPAAHVYVMGYPRLFQAGAGDCFLGRIDVSYAGRSVSVATKVTPGDATWMDSVAGDLDDIDRDAVARSGSWASYVDVAAAFDGHGLCSASALINGLSGTLALRNGREVQASISAGSFHPTAQGQQDYASLLVRAGL